MSTKKDSVSKSSQNGIINSGFENTLGDLDLGGKIKSDSQIDISIDKQREEGQRSGRPQWNNSLEFLFSCISMSVGLGNVWRFPYIAFKNGGGAFLIPYLIVLTVIGRPMYFLELVLGQFSSSNQVNMWSVSPLFKGVGYAGMVGTMYTVSFYGSTMGLTIFYLVASFQKTLPWSECSNDWIQLGRGVGLECNEMDLSYAYDSETQTKSNITISQLYFENEVLKQKDSIEDGLGAPEWRQSLCLLLSWIVIWGSLVKGISSSGKVAYFTAVFPYIVLIIMLIRGVTLPGAWNGISYFITPQWDRMLEPSVWYEAVSQCFFSLGTGFATIVMFSSYNPFRHNIYRDAWIISGLDTVTSLLAGFTVFAVLGYLADDMGVDVEKVVRAGPGLAFISYPAAIARFDWVPQLFSVLFYLMLFTLGVGTATSVVNGVITIFSDRFPETARLKITSVVCVLGFLSGLIFVTPGGQFMVELVNHYGVTFPLFVVSTVGSIVIAWIYGLNNLLRDIEFMLGVRIGWYWKLCWGFFCPVGLTVILIYSLATEKRLTYDDYTFPDSAIVCGWLMAASAVVIIPIYFTIILFKAEVKSEDVCNKLKEKLVQTSKPTGRWGPLNSKEKADWIEFVKNR